jgi:hypothetical protein
MLIAAIIMFLTGAVCGLRFKVFAVVPVVLIGWLGFVLFGMTADAGLLWTVLTLVGFAVLAQVGYMFGVSARLAAAAARVGRRRSHMVGHSISSDAPTVRPAVR